MTGRARGSMLVLLSALAWARTADAADTCPPADRPWLRLDFEGGAFDAALRGRVLQQIAADLGPRGILTCPSPAEGTPLADVRLALERPSALDIELHDAVTDKRVARSLSLQGVPSDARGLSIALAAEELLHASWIEAALAPPAPPAPRPVPAPVPAVVVATNETVIAGMPRAPVAHASAVAAADHATGGATGLGADVRVAFGGRLTAGVRAGARTSPDATSAHGKIQQRELLAGASAGYALVPRDAAGGAELVLHLDVVDLQVTGVAAPGASASSGSALALVAAGGAGGWLRLGGPWRAVIEGTVGAPLRGVTASDAGQTATGLTGVVLGAALGIGASL